MPFIRQVEVLPGDAAREVKRGAQRSGAHPRTIGWVGTTAMAMGGSNQMLFIVGALLAAHGTAAVPLLVVGLAMSWAALPGWTELILMWPDRVGGIAATCAEAFKPYSRVLANLAGTCYWWGWVPTCGLTALLSASALHQWYLPGIPVKALASGLVVAFTLVNLAGLRRVTTLAMIIAAGSASLAFLSAILPVLSGNVDWHRAASFHLDVPFGGNFGKLTSAMGGLYLIGFAAPAFEAAACHVGETVDPGRNVPRAMYASAVMATLYFLVLPVVWLGVLGPKGMVGDLALTLGPTFAPLFGAFAKAAAVWFMVLNMFHGTLTPITGVARTLSQLSEDGLLPRSLAKRTPTDVPWVASALTAAMAIVFLIGGVPVWVIAAANFTYLIGISLPSVAVWLLRRNDPDRVRLYRAPRGTIVLGLVVAFGWGLATVFGFEQFGLPTVLFGLVLAYSGAAAYAWRQRSDRAGVPNPIKRSLHLKLTGAMLLVLVLDGSGYLLAVSHVGKGDPSLVTILQDIFVAVAILTVTVGLVLPGMIAHGATQVADAADRLVNGTLADLTRAMRALARGDLDEARATIETQHVRVQSADEIGAMAASFNVIIDESARAARSLDGAREALRSHRFELEQLIAERTSLAAQQAEVAELGRVALASSDLDYVLSRATAATVAMLPAERCEIVKRQPGGMVMFSAPTDPTRCPDPIRGPAARAALRKLESATTPLVLEPALRRSIFDEDPEDIVTAAACIRTKDGPLGLLLAHRVAGAAFSTGELSFLANIAAVVGSAVERIGAEQALNYQALHDPLTKLPNRVLFASRLKRALAQMDSTGTRVAVLFIDVDQFKVVNDSLGHEAGDRLLELMAERFTSALDTCDTVARFGGDEFVVLAPNIRSREDAIETGARIQRLTRVPVTLDGRAHFVTVSTGIAVAETSDVHAMDLLRDADAAMYEAKRTGRDCSVMFAPSMRTQAIRRFDLEADLRLALTSGQICVHYQTIVNLQTGEAEGFEALARWQHPVKGMILPADFIPIAEETGLIVQLGEWVLEEACRFTQHVRTTMPTHRNVSVSVNLSGRQIVLPNIVTTVADVLERTGLDPGGLVLEITESVVMSDARSATAVLGRLKALGIRLAIDDFGTGYSSLSYLQKFPVDFLKIDRSFIEPLHATTDSRAIVQAIITLAHSLGLQTIAEGTETPAQVDILCALGCDKAQGYLYSRPQPAELLEAHLGNFERTASQRSRAGGGA